MGELATIERPEPRPNLVAGGKVAAIVPQSLDDAYRLAKAVCMAGMAPKGLDTPEKAMIAILHGMEIGLTPMTALQRIAVVNGRPTIWGDGAMSLVRGSGACEWVTESVEGAGDARAAICEAKRRGDPKPIRRTFSVADAKKAGLWGKAGPWQQFPDRMLQMRARAFCLRDGFADVLGGLYIKEEIDNGTANDGEAAPAQSAAPARKLPPAPPPPPVTSGKAPPPPPVPPTPPAPAGFDFDAFRKAVVACSTQEEADAVYDREVTRRDPALSAEDMDEADNVFREACQRFWSDEGEAS